MSKINQINVNAKLDGLNETPDSIVAVAQWIMFHRRYPQQLAQMWLVYLQQSPASKKLALMYLCNEVVQQSRSSKKFEFVNAFAEVLPSALQDVKQFSSPEVNAKVRRVVDVWNQRQIFAPTQIDSFLKIESAPSHQAHQRRKSVTTTSSPPPGNSPGPGAELVPPSIAKLAALQSTLDAVALHFNETQSKFSQMYKSLFDSESLPAPEEFVNRLDSLDQVLNSTATKAKALQQSREAVANQLTTLLDLQNRQLKQLQATIKDLDSKRTHITETRDELQAMSKGEQYQDQVGGDDDDDFAPPVYSPLSDDEEAAEPSAKKQRLGSVGGEYEPADEDGSKEEYNPGEIGADSSAAVGEGNDESRESSAKNIVAGLDGLDPSVAETLSRLVQD